MGTVCAKMVVLSGRRSRVYTHIHTQQCGRLSRSVEVVKWGRKGHSLGSEAGSLGEALTWCCHSNEGAEGHRNSRDRGAEGEELASPAGFPFS